jgi:hypothetical protein
MSGIPWQCFTAVLLATLPAFAQAASPDEVRAAAEQSLALLQKCGPIFFEKSGCVACHQQSVTSLAVEAARARGLHLDELTAREQVHVTASTLKDYRERLLQRADHPLNSAESAGFLLWGLSAEKYGADETTDALVIELAGRQSADGSWTAFGHRPPLEYSRISSTALAIYALNQYGPPGLKPAFAKRTQRGLQWLVAARPASTSDDAFQLLGLYWAGGEGKQIANQRAKLLAQQRDDGGWSPLEGMPVDAYATALSLYALHRGGELPTSDPAYQRGLEYLLKTRLPDGSWHVKSRSFPFQKYFESGFPHGEDQWISASATGFATAALIDALPPAAGPGK